MTIYSPARRVTEIWSSSLRPTSTAHHSVISLAMGEPDFDTPADIVRAATNALRDGFTHYTDFAGDADLREQLAANLSRDSGTRWSPRSITVTHGASGGLAATIMATVGPGDRVVIPSPTYSLYADLVTLAGGVPVFVRLLHDFHLDLESIAEVLPGARLVIICNPGNPTGAVLHRSELEALGLLLAGTETILVADEAYDQLVWTERGFVSALAVPSLQDRTIYVQTFSKTYAMTGWRIGYVAAPEPLSAAIATVSRTTNGSPNAAVQRAALHAARVGPSLAAPMVAEYAARRERMLEQLDDLPFLTFIPPEGAFYLFARYHFDVPSTGIVDLLHRAGVAVRAGSEYGPGGEGHIRLSFAADQTTIQHGCQLIVDALQRTLGDGENG